MASITKRNGKYLVRVRLRGNVRTKTFRTSAEAKAWAAQTEAEITSRLREWQTVTDNPISKINRPKHNPSRTRRPTADEIRRICNYLEYDELQLPALKKQRVTLAFLFVIETAMRAGEICGITWQHIDLDRRTVHLPKTKNGNSRDVPLSRCAIALLQKPLNP